MEGASWRHPEGPESNILERFSMKFIYIINYSLIIIWKEALSYVCKLDRINAKANICSYVL